MKNLVMRALIALGAIALVGCQTTRPVVLPPEIIKVRVFVPLPAECSATQTVELPPGSSALDVMAKQAQALDKQAAQIQRCFAAGQPAP